MQKIQKKKKKREAENRAEKRKFVVRAKGGKISRKGNWIKSNITSWKGETAKRRAAKAKAIGNKYLK